MSILFSQQRIRNTRAGFSLAELLLTLFILAIGLSLAWTHLGTTKNTQQVQMAAQVLADRLRQLRQEAMARGIPQAVAFPSVEGTNAQSQSCYFLEGEQKPVVTSVLNWAGEYPKALCNCGTWTLDGGTLWGTSARVGGSKTFDLANWASPHPKDPLFVFTPAGTVASNQPSFNGAYYLILSEASTYAPTKVGVLDTFFLTDLPSPWTLTISASGQVTVAPGLSSGSTVSTAYGAVTPAPALALAPIKNHTPEILGVGTNPLSNPDSLPSGIDAAVSLNGYLTFTVHATDPDGDPLSCRWIATSGTFSAAESSIMEWDPIGNYWYSNWTYHPPVAAAANQNIHLTCEVSDNRGGVVTGTLGFGGTVQTTARPKLIFLSDACDPGVTFGWYTSNVDGGERHLMAANACKVGTYCLNPRWSPDSNWLTYIYYPNWSSGGGNDHTDGALFLISKNGTGRARLLSSTDLGWRTLDSCAFSKDGTRIFVSGQTMSGKIAIGWTTLSGTKPSSPSVAGGDIIMPGVNGIQNGNNMAVHPVTGYILIATRSGSMHFYKTDGTEIPVSLPNVLKGCQICFSTAGDKLYSDSPGLPVERYDFNYVQGAASATLTNLIGITSQPYDQVGCETPDGKFFVFTRTDHVKNTYQTYKIDLASKSEYNLSGNTFTEDEVNVQTY